MKAFPQKFFPHSTSLVEKLQTGIDVRCNVPDVVLQGGIADLQSLLNFLDGVENGGVILAKLCANGGQAEICQLADQVNGNVPGFCYILCTLVATNHIFIDGIELTDLADDQAGRGQGAAFALEHVTDGPGNIG